MSGVAHAPLHVRTLLCVMQIPREARVKLFRSWASVLAMFPVGGPKVQRACAEMRELKKATPCAVLMLMHRFNLLLWCWPGWVSGLHVWNVHTLFGAADPYPALVACFCKLFGLPGLLSLLLS